MANTSLTRTVSSTGSTTTGTLSMWIKRTTISAEQYIFENYETSGNRILIRFLSSNQINLEVKQGNSTVCQMTTLGMFRDPNSWYHVVFAMDSSQATASNRLKVYINGVLQTSFTDITYPSSQNQNMSINEGNPTYVTIGRQYGASNYFDGLMSHIHWIDGTQYTASDFGETDSTTGEWKINTSPSITMGTNGFTILKDGNTITDQSSNSNDFSLGGGTLTNTEDCPSNVFPIFNGMYCPKSSTDAGAFLNGGTTTGGSPSDTSTIASMGVRSGKYYWEVKMQNAANTRSCGVVRSDSTAVHAAGIYPGGNGNASIWTVAYNCGLGYVQKNDNGTQTQQGSLATLTTGDILGVALNLTDYEIKWYKNGTLVTTTSISADWVAYGEFLLPCNRTDDNQFVQYNFGNGHFASTAVSSAGSNASGIGIFEYDVPTGYTALSTKGLNL